MEQGAASREGAYPLTEAQSGLWYAQRLDPANPLFNTGQFIELHGTLDRPAFAAALAQAVAEAGALSLRMVETPQGPLQFIDPSSRPALEIIDVSTLPDPRAAALEAIARDMARAIDPVREPLAREALFVLGPAHHIWQQRVHHLAIDGYGMILLTQRVAELYNAHRRGAPAGNPPPGVDVVLKEDADYRASARRQTDGDYWRALFADRPDVVSFTAGAPASAFSFHRAAAEIDPPAFAALRDIAGRTSIPWPDIVTALAAAYLQRHLATPEVVVGVPYMARLGSPSARVAAMLMNVLPVRVAAPGNLALDAYLATVAKSLVRARRHGRYRSEQLRRDLRLIGGQRRLHGPLVNLLPFDETPRFDGLDSRLEVLSTGPVEDITFTFRLHGAEGLRLEVDANPDLYGEAEVEAHAARLKVFIARALGADTLDAVPLATPEEAHRHVVTLNATGHALPDVTLAALIERALAATPQAPALRFSGRTMSYGELDARAGALAGALAERGVSRGDIVAVALPRSFELVVALIAILRVGAAYLPLDLTHPDERLGRILVSAAPRLALSRAPDLPRFAGRVDVLAPEDWPAAPSLGTPALAAPALTPPEPDDAAYVIYTSGSTGEPKGVVIEHRAIVNRLEWMRAHYGFQAHDRILQKTPATFDVSVWEFFLPFLAGACLVIAPPDAHRDPVALARLIVDEGVTTAHFVPSMLAAFLAEPSVAEPSVAEASVAKPPVKGFGLTRVFCSGEELPAELRARFHRTLAAELHNLYGPTEAAVDVSYWPAGPDDHSRPVPIGFPVWNTRLYVLDDRGRPQPPNVPGHLFLAGVQLARGYLGRPDLTRERFVPDPFVPGERMYLTGDLALWRTDGAVVFLGRSDHQIKIRGLRIELGEIEAAVMSCARVRQAAILAREDGGVKRIIAYVVPEPGMDEQSLRTDLATHVAARVPDYMVPAAFVALDALPVTANGKLDRAALPAPDFTGSGQRPPHTPTEHRLAALFAEQLGSEGPIAAEDDFFSLGGDSLQAVALLLRVREAFGCDPGLGALFAQPTLAGFAALIDAEAGEADVGQTTIGKPEAGLGPLITLVEADADLPPLFAIHPAGGISWCYGRLARSLSPRRTVYGVQAPALAPGITPPARMEDLAADYVARIRTVRPQGPYHLVGWSVGGIIAQAMAVQLREAGAEVGVVAMLDAYPADVWRGEPDPGENGALKALIAIAGHDPDRLPGLALTRESVRVFLRATDSPLGQLPDAALDGVVRVVAGNNRLVRGHHHRRYDGTLLHFRAALDHAGRDLSPAQWKSYARHVEVIDIAALHAHLTGPQASAAIAPLLGQALAMAEQGEQQPCVTAV
ncbi:non-ribosomal peptide synthetase [Ancylobacter pratisalsi]|uniref:Amino acid adenylation domain-containing protein n=1 Tax=Ancylobacter pratisalsi TaxID=1745854 RepID=A0A6P1YS29_9HYPH|nr:non-ribosomal peptide synthetase [Ancylobacter pratisalsi]QIB34853.1 amino acid adenylation domain-containing protein [Ancylobacter pratisalsi]